MNARICELLERQARIYVELRELTLEIEKAVRDDGARPETAGEGEAGIGGEV